MIIINKTQYYIFVKRQKYIFDKINIYSVFNLKNICFHIITQNFNFHKIFEDH